MTDAPKPRFVGELPGSGPWSMAMFGDLILLSSPNHPPMLVRDGKIEPLEPAEARGAAR